MAIAAVAAVVAYISIYAFDLAWPPIRSDGFSYYVYLPAVVLHHDLSLETTAHECCTGDYPRWTAMFRWPSTHRWLNPHPIGEALMLGPFFLAAHALTRWSNLSPDGFSFYYQYAAGLGGLVYFAAGLWFLRRFLLRRFSPGVTLATLLVCIWGTNLFHYATYDSIFSHAFAFFLFAALLDQGVRWLEHPTYGHAITVGILAGLTILVRHTNALMLWFLVPGAWVGVRDKRLPLTHLAAAAAVTAALLVPQIALYRQATGQWVFSPYAANGRFDFLAPKIVPVLFSPEKGLFFWSPALLLALAGFPLLPTYVPGFLLPTLVVLPATLWLIASWSDWQLGGSFGHRGFTDLLPIFAIAMACFFDWASRRRWTVPVAVFATVAVTLSIAQMIQYWLRIIPFSDTSWTLYKSVFLKFTR